MSPADSDVLNDTLNHGKTNEQLQNAKGLALRSGSVGPRETGNLTSFQLFGLI